MSHFHTVLLILRNNDKLYIPYKYMKIEQRKLLLILCGKKLKKNRQKRNSVLKPMTFMKKMGRIMKEEDALVVNTEKFGFRKKDGK